MHRKTHALALIAFPLIAAACEGEPDVATVAQAETVSLPYEWFSPDPPTPMGSASDRTCYLTGVAGELTGAGSSFAAFVDGGAWWLHGTSSGVDGGRWASAGCVGAPSSVDYFWAQGSPPTTMEPASSHTCFLTHVQGDFGGSGEWVRAGISGGAWTLNGASQRTGVATWARCIARPAPATEYVWTQGSPPVVMKSTATHKCFLTGVKGSFRGYDDALLIQASGGQWLLGGGGSAAPREARARCTATLVVAL